MHCISAVDCKSYIHLSKVHDQHNIQYIYILYNIVYYVYKLCIHQNVSGCSSNSQSLRLITYLKPLKPSHTPPAAIDVL